MNTFKIHDSTIRISAVKSHVGHMTTYCGNVTVTDSYGKYRETVDCHRTNVEDAIRDARKLYTDCFVIVPNELSHSRRIYGNGQI